MCARGHAVGFVEDDNLVPAQRGESSDALADVSWIEQGSSGEPTSGREVDIGCRDWCRRWVVPSNFCACPNPILTSIPVRQLYLPTMLTEPWAVSCEVARDLMASGVEAARTDNAEGFADLLTHSLKRSGPFLIELLI